MDVPNQPDSIDELLSGMLLRGRLLPLIFWYCILSEWIFVKTFQLFVRQRRFTHHTVVVVLLCLTYQCCYKYKSMYTPQRQRNHFEDSYDETIILQFQVLVRHWSTPFKKRYCNSIRPFCSSKQIEYILNCSISCYQAFLFLKMVNKLTSRKSTTKMKEIKHFAERMFLTNLKSLVIFRMLFFRFGKIFENKLAP